VHGSPRVGLLGEQVDQEVDATEVSIGQGIQPYADLWLDSTAYRSAMYLTVYAFDAMSKEWSTARYAIRLAIAARCAIRIFAFRDSEQCRD
jgi:hypothetical protein